MGPGRSCSQKRLLPKSGQANKPATVLDCTARKNIAAKKSGRANSVLQFKDCTARENFSKQATTVGPGEKPATVPVCTARTSLSGQASEACYGYAKAVLPVSEFFLCANVRCGEKAATRTPTSLRVRRWLYGTKGEASDRGSRANKPGV